MKLLIDADSLLFSACFKKKESKEDDGFNYDMEDVIHKFDNSIFKIVNTLSDIGVEIDAYKIFVQGNNNFRKIIYPKYKINRLFKVKPPLLKDLSTYVINNRNAFVSNGVETDDTIAATWNYLSETEGVDSVIIAAMDKDFKQLPAWIFDYYYTRMSLRKISEEESLYNFYYQMIIGDSGDGVNIMEGVGDKTASSVLMGRVSEFSLRRGAYELFVKNKGRRSRESWILSWNLLKLTLDGIDIPYEYDYI